MSVPGKKPRKKREAIHFNKAEGATWKQKEAELRERLSRNVRRLVVAPVTS